ncbi:MAG: APC family permease [Alphaproteobacteria bacterium]|nr:APC family permease [Alphaproteobacteria bacterium]
MPITPASIKHALMGKPLDPFRADTRHRLALITFFAWVGIGADGLSSANYGPEEAFLALAGHTHLAIFLAIVTAFTVFLIAAAYTQVIELFPNGGGGYRVASTLLGPKTGLVAGGALLIDYVLTIAISIASGVDALFSMLPAGLQDCKLITAIGVTGILTYMNLRGMKESIRFLLPVFLGFVATHTLLILYGIFAHVEGLTSLMPNAVAETTSLAGDIGWFAVLALFFKAFSLGGGTYTGLEAVSNSMNNLAEPKVKTGKATMWAVAFSLALVAAGIITLYLLWGVQKVDGETLNATAFKMVTANWEIFGLNVSAEFTGIALIFAAGLLFVAANTGFIAGPNVMALMAVDRWMPHMFSSLSNRLVTKNGVMLMGLSAVGALIATGGVVHLLVVMYSINVFLTFTLSLAGITRYRWRERRNPRIWHKLFIVALALMVCATILMVTLVEKFTTGAWKTVIVTGMVIVIGLLIRRHYDSVSKRLKIIEAELGGAMFGHAGKPVPEEKPKMDPRQATAVFLVGGSAAPGMHTFLWVQRLFPGVFKNFVFASVGEIDTEEFSDETRWHSLRRDTKTMLKNYVDFCTARGLPATYYHDYGTDVIETVSRLTERISADFPHTVFFAAKLIFEKENFVTALLHNQTAYMVQKRLHNKGQNLIIMPMKI